MNIKAHIPAVAVLSMLACGAALAQDNIIKLGAIRYTTNSSTSGIKGIGVPPGADAETGDATTVIFVFERTLTPRTRAVLFGWNMKFQSE